MASMALVLIVGGMSIAALFWCLKGFSRARKEQTKLVGVFVRHISNPQHRPVLMFGTEACDEKAGDFELEQIGSSTFRLRLASPQSNAQNIRHELLPPA
jgi:hypothetical protein